MIRKYGIPTENEEYDIETEIWNDCSSHNIVYINNSLCKIIIIYGKLFGKEYSFIYGFNSIDSVKYVREWLKGCKSINDIYVQVQGVIVSEVCFSGLPTEIIYL